MAKLIHYRSKCIGCGVCQELQPDVWRMSKKDGKAVLLNATAKKDVFILSLHTSNVESSRRTAEACPAHIIKLT
jgi:ferredoxin